jgi:5S rRNA maturation endonuclease (ribonuclease M5)
MQELQCASRRYPGGLLLLLDPDVAGRQARRLLDERLPGCLHAFVPSTAAVSKTATR